MNITQFLLITLFSMPLLSSDQEFSPTFQFKSELDKELFLAVFNNQYQTIQTLVDADADIDMLDSQGTNLLLFAISNNRSLQTCKALLEAGINVHQENSYDHSAMKNALQKENKELLQLIFSYKPSLNLKVQETIYNKISTKLSPKYSSTDPQINERHTA